MTHYTNPHIFGQYPSVCTKKSIKLRLSYAFADFRNIAQRAKLCKTVQNVPNSLYSFKWKTRAYLWIVEIRCWKFLTNFIPKYHCGKEGRSHDLVKNYRTSPVRRQFNNQRDSMEQYFWILEAPFAPQADSELKKCRNSRWIFMDSKFDSAEFT